jgi:hypothetical protein
VSDGDAAPPLVEIHILDMPLDVYSEASEHGDELMREFTLIKERDPEDSRAVPRRLLQLVDTLTVQFATFTTAEEAELRAALGRGERFISLTYRVPATIRQACIDLDRLLDEADEFCRAGQELLTLATPPRAVAFRKWFLDEFVHQVDGRPPTTWEQFRAASS